VATKAPPQQDHIDRFLDAVRDELPELDLTIEGIVERIGGLNRRLHRMLDETLAEQGLVSSEWKTLSYLRQAGPPYRRSPGKLAERADLSSGAMTNRLDRLEAAGLIRRLPDPTDRRAIQVELTETGHKAYDKSISIQAAKEAEVVSALNAREREQLNGLLRRVMLAAEREQGE
jgi:DNA-binding MarR family transcriptional regulator